MPEPPKSVTLPAQSTCTLAPPADDAQELPHAYSAHTNSMVVWGRFFCSYRNHVQTAASNNNDAPETDAQTRAGYQPRMRPSNMCIGRWQLGNSCAVLTHPLQLTGTLNPPSNGYTSLAAVQLQCPVEQF